MITLAVVVQNLPTRYRGKEADMRTRLLPLMIGLLLLSAAISPLNAAAVSDPTGTDAPLPECFQQTDERWAGKELIGSFQAVDVLGHPISTWDMFLGLIPGSIGETSVLAILIGAVILLFTKIASWKTMVSVFVGGAVMSLIFNMIGTTVAMCVSPLDHLFLGGFAFGAVFMATDPVTSARTETGKYIYGFLVGAMAIIIRALNPGYPEGMMLAILLMNVFAPLIDYYVVEANINRRLKRVIK